MKRILVLLAIVGLFAPGVFTQQDVDPDDQTTQPAERLGLEERIEVLEEPWKVGDVKTYSLIFDYAPFGRQTIRLDRIMDEGGERVLEFSQMLHLDLRALGQEGSLYNFGKVKYARGKMFREYRFDEVLKSWAGYATYEPRNKMKERIVSIERSGDEAAFSISSEGKGSGTLPMDKLSSLGSSVLVDLEIMGHWERLFLFDSWELGADKTIPMMLPSEPVVYDYHLPVKDFRAIRPRVSDVILHIEEVESVSVFSIEIEAFRCTIPELGYTVWVTRRGGVIKFDNGKGLTGVLER